MEEKRSMNYIKVLAIILIVIVVANIIFFGLGLITPMVFWVVIIMMALLAWFGIPTLREREELGKIK